MGQKSGKRHALHYNKIVWSFMQGQWMGVEHEGLFNG